MENRNSYSLALKNDSKLLRTFRNLAPADFIFKIQSFSSLLSWGTKKVQSRIFESGGYKWRLLFYPKGKHEGGNISLYLSIVDTNMLPDNWEVNVDLRFFVFNQQRNEYLCFQDAEGKVLRFHCLKTEWGFERLLSSYIFNNSKNGYLANDSCAFGAEIYVIKPNKSIFECVSGTKTYTWKIDDFKKVEKCDILYSSEFVIGGWKWKLLIYPNANEGKSLSLFLCFLDNMIHDDDSKLIVDYKLRILDPIGLKNRELSVPHKELTAPRNWGFKEFIALEELKKEPNNFIVGNTLTVETEFCSISILKGIEN